MNLERITQPMTDAVERPLTLVEKLQAKVDRLKAIGASQDKIETASECLNIAQQHSDWVSVDERLPSDGSLRYELFSSSNDMTLRHRFCHCDDVKKSIDATHWRVAQQPPGEVQE